MSKTYNQKNAKSGRLGKVLGIIAAILAAVIILGTIVVFNVVNSGVIQKTTKAIATENYKVSSAMLTYYFNSTYQNFVSTYGDYLESVQLDPSKDLKEQKSSDGSGTWYDYFLNSAESNARQLLVLCEAARVDDSFDYDKMEEDINKEIDESVKSLKAGATANQVTLGYYLAQVYGQCVDEGVIRDCMFLSEMASHYSQHIVDGLKYEKADWDTYYNENTKSFLKADWLTYSFTITEEKAESGATDEEKAAVEANNQAAYEANKVYAQELSQVTDADSFKAYVEGYLRNVKYAGMDEAALAEDKVDIPALVSGCEKLGNTGASETELNKWAFAAERVGYETYVETKDDTKTVNVYMILPVADATDLGLACQYRDAYTLRDYTYVPFLASSYNNKDADAKAAAEQAFEEFNEDKTQENIDKLAEEYSGNKSENADKGALSDEVDAWLYDAARAAGDCELIQAEDKGYYIVYYTGEGDVKWEAQADTALVNEAYSDNYAELEETYKATSYVKGLDLVVPVDLSGAVSSSSSN